MFLLCTGTIANAESLKHFVSWRHPKLLVSEVDVVICKDVYQASISRAINDIHPMKLGGTKRSRLHSAIIRSCKY